MTPDDLAAIRAEHGPDGGTCPCQPYPCVPARLLSEVDRLTALLEDAQEVLVVEDQRIVRIRAAMEAIPEPTYDGGLMWGTYERTGWDVAMEAVLAAIDGEGKDCLHRTWLTMDPPVCAECGKVGETR